jgi:zinc and cadmium transporter
MWLALAVSLAAAMVTVAGILAVRMREGWVQRHRAMLTAFAAGILLAIAFLHLIPDAFEENGGQAAAGLIGGFLILYLVGRLVISSAGGSYGPEQRLGLAALIAIGFHSFVDGVLFSIGFSVSATTGFLIAPGMILHEFVEGILVYKLLLFGGFRRVRALWLSIAAAALTTPLGVLVSWPLISELQAHAAAMLIAGAAGSLIYVGGSHLLPLAEENEGPQTTGFLAGVALGILIVLLKHAGG